MPFATFGESMFRILFRMNLCLVLITLLVLCESSAHAQAPLEQLAPLKEMVITSHLLHSPGGEFEYTATTGFMPLRTETGELRAKVFFVAYTRGDAAQALGGDSAERPITFTFNGGPGSSSVWLHLGMFGPKRVAMPDDAQPPKPPFQLVENEHSLLDVSDFVFIDPVMTGYSRPADDVEKAEFHGYEEDLESVGEFIRRYLTKFKRWDSPKFLAGESYGTTRAAGLSGHLIDRHGIYLNGIVLISSVLNFQTIRFGSGNDLPYMLFLPTCTATAWYHKQLDDDLQADLQQTLREVEEFALGEYNVALAKGDRLSADEQEAIAAKLARYTGLSKEFVLQANLRISMSRFAKELLRDQRQTVGRLDSRYLGVDRDAAGEAYEFDPSYAAIYGAYTALLNNYVRDELNFSSELPYEILTGRVQPWSYAGYENQYLDTSETLRSAMAQNPSLQVYVASGYYDFATPYFAADYAVAHMSLEESERKRIRVGYYDAGHMMYIHEPSLVKLREQLLEFYAEADGVEK